MEIQFFRSEPGFLKKEGPAIETSQKGLPDT